MKTTFQTTKKERFAYCLFFLGQNILWGYAGYVETFLTDIGIAAATAAVILLVPKVWDAVNDILFGYLMDRFTFRSGQKFLPWVRIGTAAVTTRGLGEEEMKRIAHCISLTARDFEGTQAEVHATVADICEKFPMYK